MITHKNKMKLLYDRKEGKKFVPNGYPIDEPYYKNIEVYINNVGKEPVVHDLLDLDRMLDYEPCFRDEVEENFFYPVQQFGSIDKLIGKEEPYKEYGFYKNIHPDTLKKLQQGKGDILIFACEESRFFPADIIFLHKRLKELKIPLSNVYYFTGWNWSAKNEYEWVSDLWGETDTIHIINTKSQMYLKGNDLCKFENSKTKISKKENQKKPLHSQNTFVTYQDMNERAKRNHQFLCYNRRIRPPRYCMIAMLHYHKLLEKNLVSFDIVREHNLNCLGNNGKPDVNTMKMILGRGSEVLQKYTELYTDIRQMSPRIIDFDVREVMGPGCEVRESYSDSYFSIVTETAFNEYTWCLTEKVFRPFLHFHPFIVQGSPHTIKRLREMGFKTFHPHIDGSYDREENVKVRMEMITKEIIRLCSMTQDEMHEWYYGMTDILYHNREHIKDYGKKYNTYLQDCIESSIDWIIPHSGINYLED